MHAIYIRTQNDTNGNPRRGWIVQETDEGLGSFFDEGYGGSRAASKAIAHHYGVTENIAYVAISKAQTLEVKPSEYRKWLKASV